MWYAGYKKARYEMTAFILREKIKNKAYRI